MKRSHLIAVIGVLILLAALAWVFWPADSNGPDQQAEQGEKSEVPEGVLLIDAKQIAASSIEIEAVQFYITDIGSDWIPSDRRRGAECQRTDRCACIRCGEEREQDAGRLCQAGGGDRADRER